MIFKFWYLISHNSLFCLPYAIVCISNLYELPEIVILLYYCF